MATGEAGGRRQGPARGSPGSCGIGSVPSGAERSPEPPLCLRGCVCPALKEAEPGLWRRLPGAQRRPCRARAARPGGAAPARLVASTAPARRLPQGRGSPEPDGPGGPREGAREGPEPCGPQQRLPPQCGQQEGRKAPGRL
ncbi:proline-rich proteoglycan 2-like [Melospiza georgiana]|uniref:proline-rich proteoglycan 2-like n=1 Tax=Melospiza georgiana TaxID=44398 RepID=UPI0025AD6CD7|nr:proline-rich proteoglycan 2-like [Melospiza georgiana]